MKIRKALAYIILAIVALVFFVGFLGAAKGNYYAAIGGMVLTVVLTVGFIWAVEQLAE